MNFSTTKFAALAVFTSLAAAFSLSAMEGRENDKQQDSREQRAALVYLQFHNQSNKNFVLRKNDSDIPTNKQSLLKIPANATSKYIARILKEDTHFNSCLQKPSFSKVWITHPDDDACLMECEIITRPFQPHRGYSLKAELWRLEEGKQQTYDLVDEYRSTIESPIQNIASDATVLEITLPEDFGSTRYGNTATIDGHRIVTYKNGKQ